MKKALLLKALIVIFAVLFIDQFVKIWIKTHFFYGEHIHVLGINWFQIHFIENNGMAFGMEFAGNYGKIFLTVFRLIASSGIAYYLYYLIKKQANSFLIITIALIFTGAIGNILDSMFYGMMFSESTGFDKAVFMPEGGGYSAFLYGRVVDMFYFPIINTTWPQWIPFIGGSSFEFFAPIFNVADSAITIGVFILLIFQKRLFKPKQAVEDMPSIFEKEE